jgi:hypothetical protein
MYGIWTWVEDGGSRSPASTALILTGGLALIVGSYFWFVSRRIDRGRGPARRGHRRGRGRARLLQPGQLLADRDRARGDGRRPRVGLQRILAARVGIIGVLFAAGGLLFEYYTRGHTTPTF